MMLGHLLPGPILIGPGAALIAIEAALAAVRAGQSHTLILSGETGIGKSRLIAAARTQAQLTGLSVLEGHCGEPNQTLPYAPWLDLLHTVLPACRPQRSRLY